MWFMSISLSLSVHLAVHLDVEMSKVAKETGLGFAVLGFLGFAIKLAFMPVNTFVLAKIA